MNKERMILKIGLLIEDFNKELDNQPNVEDIPDDIWTNEQLEMFWFAQKALLDSVKYRNRLLSELEREARAAMERKE